MRIDVFTLFPEMFAGPLTESILKRARETGTLSVTLHNIRDYATDRHHTADDTPYGGGGGMLMKPEPVVAAIEHIVPQGVGIPVILLSPQGRVFNQDMAQSMAAHDRLALVCGHYEGVDERVRQTVITDEVSIGDYVLTGGELAAMVIIDAVTRLLPGVLGDPDGPINDSHATGLLEHPHYTRPPEFRGLRVPDVLLSGHEGNITRWRRQQALRRTWQRRPDLLLTAPLTTADREYLLTLAQEEVERRAATHREEPPAERGSRSTQ
jgi:tRNA (guanine37-N1)-methyltransferase